jgi:hypothetical protein
MIKSDPKLVERLEQEALWLVMHPLKHFDDELHEIFPWLKSETIRLSNKIEFYLRDVKHRAMVSPTAPIRFFSNYLNFLEEKDLVKYTSEHKIKEIVYCGFHHGCCILSEKHLGMIKLSKIYKCYLKHDLTTISGTLSSGWESADHQTQEHGTII